MTPDGMFGSIFEVAEAEQQRRYAQAKANVDAAFVEMCKRIWHPAGTDRSDG